jgi:hypothetical protein
MTLASRFRRWVDAKTDAGPVARFRIAFAAVWLAYDALDLVARGTAACSRWYEAPDHAPPQIVFLQIGLIACEVSLLLGFRVGLSALVAAFLRYLEWDTFLRLNDFQYFIVTAIILATARGTGGILSPAWEGKRVPAWPREVLILQAAWMYAATALLKCSPAWLDGGQLFVRHQYLAARGWPFPGFYLGWVSSLGFNAALARMAVAGELALVFLLVFHRRRALVVPLAAGIHGFAALSANVWFFGASCLAQVALLVEDRVPPTAGAGPPTAGADPPRPGRTTATSGRSGVS